MTDTLPPRRALRSVGAVLAGVVTIVLLSHGTDALLHGTGVFPPAGQPMAGVLFLLALVYRSALATWNEGPEFGPKWYALAVAASALPSTGLGARLAGGRA